MLRILLIGFCIFCFFSGRAQTDYNVLHYTTENGLPSNGIKGVAFDTSTGYLWIGSEAGIIRFNGTQFKVYNNQNTKGLASDRLDFMEKSVDGHIYARDQLLNWFRIEKNQPIYLPKNIITLKESELEYLHLFLKNEPIKKIINEREAHDLFYLQFIMIGDTACLMQYIENKLAYASTNTKQVTLLGSDKDAYSIFKIDSKIFAWTKKKSLCLYDTKQQQFNPISIKNEAGDIIPINIINYQLIGGNENSPPFLFNGRNVWSLSYKNNSIVARKISSDFPIQTMVRSVCVDPKNKMIFVSTSSKGLVVLKPKQVRPIKNETAVNQIRNSHYSQIVIDSNTILTNNGVLIGDKTNKKTPIPLGEIFYATIFKLKDSLLFFMRSKNSEYENTQINIYNYKTNKLKAYKKIETREVFAVYYDNDTIYMNTTNGMGYMQGDSIHYVYKTTYPNIQENKMFAMEKVGPGLFWVASCEGLIEYDIYKKTRRYVLQFPGICVRNIKRIDNDIYIGTYGKGFYIYRNNKLQAMPLDKNNYLAFAHCFMPDNMGYIWISTNRGLFKASKKDLQTAFDQKTTSLYYHYLGKDDGMEITEMNGGCAPCAVQMNSETLSFPTMDGLLWVNPKKAGTLLPEGNIYIDNVVVDNKIYTADSFSIGKLPSSTNIIDIKLDYLAWCNKENIYIEYKLNDAKDWKRLNNESGAVIHFENLAGGNYKLFIRKRNGFGVNNFCYKEIPFYIEIPFYKSWWFYFFCFLGTLGFIGLAFKARTRQLIRQKNHLQNQINQKTKSLQQQNEVLEKNNQINSRLISIISHDIITPLKFMAMGSKKLLDKKHVMPAELQEETITEITNTAQELQLLSTNILNWIKYQNKHRRQQSERFAPADVIQQVFRILTPIAADKNIQLLADADPQLQILQFREPFKILLYNLITNAIQFSINCQILVEVHQENNQITLSVTDEGVGMTSTQIQNILSDQFIISSVNVDNKKGNGLGYLIIKDLIKLLQGKLAIESEKGKGTVVAITMPFTLIIETD